MERAGEGGKESLADFQQRLPGEQLLNKTCLPTMHLCCSFPCSSREEENSGDLFFTFLSFVLTFVATLALLSLGFQPRRGDVSSAGFTVLKAPRSDVEKAESFRARRSDRVTPFTHLSPSAAEARTWMMVETQTPGPE